MCLTKNYFGEIVPTCLAIHPFSGDYGAEGKTFARFGGVANGDSVHFAIPYDGVYARYFALADRLDTGYGKTLFAYGLLQCLGGAAGRIEFVDMVYLGHMRGILWVCLHEFCQLTIERKEDIHANAIVG